MKKQVQFFSVIALFVMGALFTQSCEKIKEAAAFNVQQELPDHHFDLDSSATSSKGEALLYSAYYEINIDSIFKANDIDKGKISEGKFKKILISIEDPKDAMQFGFLSSISFRLGENEDQNDAVIIASAKDIKQGDTEIVFDVNDDNMDKYLEQDKFFFFVFGTLTGPVPVEKLPLIIKSQIEFKVSPLN
ncbi:MAG: hypothetical protein KAG84_01660 [Bacteroidales bacterium]|nr:hypothetical protein [Bacteroidales bacterium]